MNEWSQAYDGYGKHKEKRMNKKELIEFLEESNITDGQDQKILVKKYKDRYSINIWAEIKTIGRKKLR